MSTPTSHLHQETVLEVRHWNDSLFSFKTTRDAGFRFKNGHFVMLGLEIEGKPLLRAYSVASANYEEHLEFYSIKVPDGPLTSRLQHLKPGDRVLVGKKPTGTLVTGHLLPGKRLYLLGTGTGLAPFMSMIRDPDVAEQFEHVVLAQRRALGEVSSATLDYIRHELPQHEYIGEQVRNQLRYYPTVTRELFENQGRLTELLDTGKLCADVGLPDLNPEHDRVMICGNPSMLGELIVWRGCARGFREGKSHEPAHYTVERAFVER